MSLFSLTGRILDCTGRPWPNAIVAIVDRDLLRDDLISIVGTREDGSFRSSFARAAFTQDPLEFERTPDLYLVVSMVLDGTLRTLAQLEIAERTEPETTLALGDLRLPCTLTAPRPPSAEWPAASPGSR